MVDIIFEDIKIERHLDYLGVSDTIWKHKKDFYNQPTLKNPNTGNNIGFTNKIEEWFIYNNITYKLFWVSNSRTGISFEKMSDLILFKLTWM